MITNTANLSFSYEYVYYSTISDPIGSSIVSVDTPKTYDPISTSVIYGSGGGVFNDTNNNQISGGRGGGSIQLYCGGGTVTLDGAVLRSNGGNPTVGSNINGVYPGAGSGGSISIVASTLTVVSGTLSVIGGNSYYSTSGAGGGGRVYLNAASAVDAVTNLDIDTGGGIRMTNSEDYEYFCLSASGGTLYTEFAGIASIYVDNDSQTGSAVTLVDIPSGTGAVSLINNAIVYFTTTLVTIG